MRARVGFAPRRNVAVTDHAVKRIFCINRVQKCGEALVLDRFKVREIGAFKLDPDRKVVAVVAPGKARDARVPGTLGAAHKLRDRTRSMKK